MREKNPRPVGRIDFLGSDGKVGEICCYYTEEDFLKAVKKENYYGVEMTIYIVCIRMR